MKEIKEDDIIKFMKEHGFVLEEDIKSILEKRDWIVDSSIHYKDPDEGTSREIDIIASKIHRITFGSSSSHLHLRTDLLIQCRNIRDPIIFLSIKKSRNEEIFWNEWLRFYPPLKYVYQPIESDPKSKRVITTAELLGLFKLFRKFQPERKVVNLKIMPQKLNKENTNKTKDPYGDIVIDMVKSINAQDQELQRHISVLSQNGKNTFIYPFALLFPVIVLTEEFYEYYRQDNQGKCHKTNHLQMMTDYISSSVSGKFQFDIVSKSYFETYLNEKIEKIMDKVFRRLELNINSIIRFGQN